MTRPVYAVYDGFSEVRPQVDWAGLFQLGLGRIKHATVTRHVRPHVNIVETTSPQPSGDVRRDVRWITDIGELHEWHLGEWLQEHLIKTPADYRIMARALSTLLHLVLLNELKYNFMDLDSMIFGDSQS